jgi:hypothetical protein
MRAGAGATVVDVRQYIGSSPILHASSRASQSASGMTVFLPRAAGARRLPVHGVDQRRPVNGRITALLDHVT